MLLENELDRLRNVNEQQHEELLEAMERGAGADEWRQEADAATARLRAAEEAANEAQAKADNRALLMAQQVLQTEKDAVAAAAAEVEAAAANGGGSDGGVASQEAAFEERLAAQEAKFSAELDRLMGRLATAQQQQREAVEEAMSKARQQQEDALDRAVRRGTIPPNRTPTHTSQHHNTTTPQHHNTAEPTSHRPPPINLYHTLLLLLTITLQHRNTTTPSHRHTDTPYPRRSD